MRVPAVWFAVSLMALAVPMALRKVPPNGFYGFRVPKTRSSPEVWYAANQKAGINLLVAGGLTVLITGILAATVGAARANALSLPTMVVLVLASLAVSFAQLHRM